MNFRHGIGMSLVALALFGCGSKQTGDDATKSASGSGGTTGGTDSGSGGSATGGSSGDFSAGSGGSATGGSSSGGSSSGGSATGGSATGGSAAGGKSTGGSSMGGSGTAGSAGTSPGAGGTNAGAGGSGGATGEIDVCTNTFGDPVLLIPDTPGVLRQSLSISGDDLELYYEERRPDHAHLMVQRRTDRNAAFGPATELEGSIWSWCPDALDPSLDVSDDGLRLYLTCIDTTMQNANGGYTSGPIRLATRTARTGTFMLQENTFGTGNVSISVSQDELTAFWSDYSTTTNPLPVMAMRASISDPFGAAMALPGITDSVRQPELADDGEHLFGSVQLLNANFHLFMYTRTGGNGTFLPVDAHDIVVQQTGYPGDDPSTPAIEGASDYSPTVTSDCNSLYFMRRTVMADGSSTSEVFVAKR